MLIADINFKLKDGRDAVLRSPKYEDIPEMIDCLRTTAAETEFVLRYPEECDELTVEAEKAFFDNVNSSDSTAMLVCLVEGKLVGSCRISWESWMKTRHRASVAVALMSEYWGQGIGTKMFAELIRIAEENPNLLQIELDFVEGNSRARALYEKMGFKITGVRPNAIRLRDGTLLDEYNMIRKIER